MTATFSEFLAQPEADRALTRMTEQIAAAVEKALDESNACQMTYPTEPTGQLADFCGGTAITFCGDCGKKLCKECAEVCCVETWCQGCKEFHEKEHVFPTVRL